MKKTRACPKCGSREIIRSARVGDYYNRGAFYNFLALYIHQNPAARLFKRTKYYAIWAWVCTDCGYTEFYAENTEDLKQTHQTLKAHRGKPR